MQASLHILRSRLWVVCSSSTPVWVDDQVQSNIGLRLRRTRGPKAILLVWPSFRQHPGSPSGPSLGYPVAFSPQTPDEFFGVHSTVVRVSGAFRAQAGAPQVDVSLLTCSLSSAQQRRVDFQVPSFVDVLMCLFCPISRVAGIHYDCEMAAEARLPQPPKHFFNTDVPTFNANITICVSVASEIQELVVAGALQEALDFPIEDLRWSSRHIEIEASNLCAIVLQVTVHVLTVCNDALQVVTATCSCFCCTSQS